MPGKLIIKKIKIKTFLHLKLKRPLKTIRLETSCLKRPTIIIIIKMEI
jgi:hypothetical protein